MHLQKDSLFPQEKEGLMRKNIKPVYLLATDRHLLAHWQSISAEQWQSQEIEYLDQLPEEGALVLIDVELINWRDDDWLQCLQKQRVLLASCYPNDAEGQTAIVLGAKAYLHAYSSPALIEQALTQVQYGQIWVGESLLSRLLSQLGKELPEKLSWQQGLTAREITIAQRAALGHSNQLIANDLGISVRTVRAHLGSIFEKLHITDRLMLALKVHGIS